MMRIPINFLTMLFAFIAIWCGTGGDSYAQTKQPIPLIVEGQMQGAFAMGIGQTLTESLTDSSNSAGNGGWNLNRYRLPLKADCAVGKARFNIIPPLEDDEPRGISEVVFNPVPAAIVNAIADATGVRFTQLPIKPIDIKGALK